VDEVRTATTNWPEEGRCLDWPNWHLAANATGTSFDFEKPAPASKYAFLFAWHQNHAAGTLSAPAKKENDHGSLIRKAQGQ
jgi:hypothetical protein